MAVAGVAFMFLLLMMMLWTLETEIMTSDIGAGCSAELHSLHFTSPTPSVIEDCRPTYFDGALDSPRDC